MLIDCEVRLLAHLLNEGMLVRFGLRLHCLLELCGLLPYRTHLGPHRADFGSALL